MPPKRRPPSSSPTPMAAASTPAGEPLEILRALVREIEDTDGALQYGNGTVAPACAEDWTRLGAIYLRACRVLGRPPKLRQSKYQHALDEFAL